MDLFQELEWRDLVHDASQGVQSALAGGPLTLYAGFDPTAESLHVGSLLPLITLARFQRAGHTPIALGGGGTGLIGDPSGKIHERTLLSPEDVSRNLAGIGRQMAHFLDFDRSPNAALLLDNAEWLTRIGFIDFLRDVGKHFTVNAMLAKESVKRRLSSEEGISFTEFSYMLLQAYDYLVLHERHGCVLQIGGSDQWGNITAGMELIRRIHGRHVHGLTFPLLTTAAGTKFGKTEEGAVWLDPGRTSPFKFHQYFLNTDDRDVVGLLKKLTFLERGDVEDLERSVREEPEKRRAQRALATHLTDLVHGVEARRRAEHAAGVLFSEELMELPVEELMGIFDDVPSIGVRKEEVAGEGLPLFDLLARTDLAASRGEARRLVKGGGVYLNNRRVTDAEAKVTLQDAVGGVLFIFRRGKKSWFLVKIDEHSEHGGAPAAG